MKNGVVVDTKFKDSSDDTSHYVISNEISIDLDYTDMLELCIQKENESFRTYAGLLIHARNNMVKETLMVLMEEEIKHKLRFEMKYEKLPNKK